MATGVPAALVNAMNGPAASKPFTYLPGGLDFSELRSPRMAKRLGKQQQQFSGFNNSNESNDKPAGLPFGAPRGSSVPRLPVTDYSAPKPEFKRQKSISDLLSMPDGEQLSLGPLPQPAPASKSGSIVIGKDPYNPYAKNLENVQNSQSQQSNSTFNSQPVMSNYYPVIFNDSDNTIYNPTPKMQESNKSMYNNSNQNKSQDFRPKLPNMNNEHYAIPTPPPKPIFNNQDFKPQPQPPPMNNERYVDSKPPAKAASIPNAPPKPPNPPPKPCAQLPPPAPRAQTGRAPPAPPPPPPAGYLTEDLVDLGHSRQKTKRGKIGQVQAQLEQEREIKRQALEEERRQKEREEREREERRRIMEEQRLEQERREREEMERLMEEQRLEEERREREEMQRFMEEQRLEEERRERDRLELERQLREKEELERREMELINEIERLKREQEIRDQEERERIARELLEFSPRAKEQDQNFESFNGGNTNEFLSNDLDEEFPWIHQVADMEPMENYEESPREGVEVGVSDFKIDLHRLASQFPPEPQGGGLPPTQKSKKIAAVLPQPQASVRLPPAPPFSHSSKMRRMNQNSSGPLQVDIKKALPPLPPMSPPHSKGREALRASPSPPTTPTNPPISIPTPPPPPPHLPSLTIPQTKVEPQYSAPKLREQYEVNEPQRSQQQPYYSQQQQQPYSSQQQKKEQQPYYSQEQQLNYSQEQQPYYSQQKHQEQQPYYSQQQPKEQQQYHTQLQEQEQPYYSQRQQQEQQPYYSQQQQKQSDNYYKQPQVQRSFEPQQFQPSSFNPAPDFFASPLMQPSTDVFPPQFFPSILQGPFGGQSFGTALKPMFGGGHSSVPVVTNSGEKEFRRQNGNQDGGRIIPIHIESKMNNNIPKSTSYDSVDRGVDLKPSGVRREIKIKVEKTPPTTPTPTPSGTPPPMFRPGPNKPLNPVPGVSRNNQLDSVFSEMQQRPSMKTGIVKQQSLQDQEEPSTIDIEERIMTLRRASEPPDARKAVMGEFASFAGGKPSRIAQRKKPSQSPSMWLLGRTYMRKDEDEDENEEVVEGKSVSKEYNGDQGRYLPPKNGRPSSQQSSYRGISEL